MNGRLWRLLAWRYLRGRRGQNMVPLLSRISMVAIAVSSGALIVLFSVFNGFNALVQDLYKSFYSDVRITAAKGKFFSPAANLISDLSNAEGIVGVAPVLEDNVLVNSRDEQITIKGKGR